jgi:hypothetical protein
VCAPDEGGVNVLNLDGLEGLLAVMRSMTSFASSRTLPQLDDAEGGGGDSTGGGAAELRAAKLRKRRLWAGAEIFNRSADEGVQFWIGGGGV